MLREELIKRSPIRILEKSIHGGLGAGNLGVFTARKGVGKTACLVHFAIDHLLRGRKALHISLADDPQHIQSWYKQVFSEVASAYKLDRAFDIFDEIMYDRLILHFRTAKLELTALKESAERLLKNAGFKPDILIVDGYPFDRAAEADLILWKSIAKELAVEIWFSATLHRENMQLDEEAIPSPINSFKSYFSVIIMLNTLPEFIELNLLKDHESKDLEKLHLRLDPKTLLIANRRV